MSLLQPQPTLAQEKYLRPKRLTATGTFDATIDSVEVIFQTTTLQHDPERALYNIDGRHADNSVTIKEIHIRIPDNVRTGSIIDLSKQEFTEVAVWYSLRSPTEHYSVDCTAGTLTILTLSHGVIAISGELRGTTEADPNGNSHVVDVDFDLVS
ncbi:hypothetical protein [Pseudomonas sp.]|uniref:hypothetical protein n=1 Tax=Pseudomonas sp. TaxID=306 RepID=UPI003D6FABED